MIDAFEADLQPLRRQLIEHPLFQRLRTVEHLRHFMQAHVFAVWDFMSLLKVLQRQLTCTQIPWTPPPNRQAARLINEIVLGEETDEVAPGECLSHFELYVEAMRAAGTTTDGITAFLSELALTGGDWARALRAAQVPPYVRSFVASTMHFCTLAPHEVGAAFLYGREDVIPDMFRRILLGVPPAHQGRFRGLKVYLERHIEVDGGEHGPMARRLIESLCGVDSARWREAGAIARVAMRARVEFWDGIMADLSFSNRDASPT